MHTTEELEGTDFQYQSDGHSVSRDDVMPSIKPTDRVGVVMGAGTDGLGAGNFILSCVIAFYERVKESKENLIEYPDYYTFQATADPADYRMFDIYPDHKNVIVDPDDEKLLQAINDRAINILLVPDVLPRTPGLDKITQRSTQRVVEDCYLYSPDGVLSESEFSIQVPRQPTHDWYQATVQSMDTVSNNPLTSVGFEEDNVIQEFRSISLEESLSRLPTKNGD